MSRAVLHPEDNREFLRSARHYEKEVEGLGRDFIDCVEECRDRIVRNHGLKAQPHKAQGFSPTSRATQTFRPEGPAATPRIAGDLSGRDPLPTTHHRAEALCFARPDLQPGKARPSRTSVWAAMQHCPACATIFLHHPFPPLTPRPHPPNSRA